MDFFKTPNSYFIYFEEVILSSLMKIIELLKVSEFEIFSNGIHIFSKPFFIYLNGRSHIILSLGICDEMNLNSWRLEIQGESLGKSFYSLSFNFQKFRIHSLSDNQSNNQSNLSIYYNIPKFRILGCYKPTTLKMNLVLEIRRG